MTNTESQIMNQKPEENEPIPDQAKPNGGGK